VTNAAKPGMEKIPQPKQRYVPRIQVFLDASRNFAAKIRLMKS